MSSEYYKKTKKYEKTFKQGLTRPKTGGIIDKPSRERPAMNLENDTGKPKRKKEKTADS